MKLIIILSVVLASALANELRFDRNSNSNGDVPQAQRARIVPVPEDARHNQHSASSNSNSFNNQDSNEFVSAARRNSLNARAPHDSVFTPEYLRSLFQSSQQVQASNSNAAGDSSLGYWSSYPDAAAFDAKIKARLSSSRVLADKPEIRRKIAELAEEKYNQCKGLVEDRERACLGRSTGQVMQLVAAVENMHRNQQ